VLAPLDSIGPRTSLIVVSGVFGVLALVAFKHISWQKGIKAVKDRIKAHVIEIRLYQDDLRVVSLAVGKILLRNFQYLGLNFGPFLPLAIPFVLVCAQLVTRYAYSPLPLEEAAGVHRPGSGTLIEVQLAPGHEREVAGLRVRLPEGLLAISPLVRAPADGRAFQEFVATQSGEFEIEFSLADGTLETKRVVAGDASARAMQPRRVSNSTNSLSSGPLIARTGHACSGPGTIRSPCVAFRNVLRTTAAW
jgi:hypothetical protein